MVISASVRVAERAKRLKRVQKGPERADIKGSRGGSRWVKVHEKKCGLAPRRLKGNPKG